MSEFHVMNFASHSSREDGKNKALGSTKSNAEKMPNRIIDSTGLTLEETLKKAYLNHPKRLMTEVTRGDVTSTETLEGLIFPASELLELLTNQETDVKSLYIEFCHHDKPSTEPFAKAGFSFILTGLDENDTRVRTEKEEVRVYEFAQSCPSRCPNG